MYQGHTRIFLPEEKLAQIYEKRKHTELIKELELINNQYLVALNENGTVVDKFRIKGDQILPLIYKPMFSNFLHNVRPRNLEQEMAFDMLQDSEITIKALTGTYGAGKDYIMIAAALQFMEKGVYDKLIYIRNNIEVKDTTPIGALPGELEAKLLPFAMPLADHVGGVRGLIELMDRGMVEVEHLGHIRGRDFKKSIILSSEAENLTKEHVQLLIGRVGEGSALWLNGDRRQVDKEVFKQNSGLKTAVDKLKGNRLFGYVDLIKSERSETSSLADLLD